MVKPPIAQKAVDASSACAYFTVRWSHLEKAERYQVIGSVPALPGIFELYYQDEHKRLHLLLVSKAWYGGLRAAIRKRMDPELEVDPARRKILETYGCLYRYCLVSSRRDMDDLLFFFSETYRPGSGMMSHSGRYEQIFVEEISSDRIVTV